MKIIDLIFINQIKNANLATFRYMLDNDITFMEYYSKNLVDKEDIKNIFNLININPNEINAKYLLNLIEMGNETAYKMILTHKKGKKWVEKSLIELKKYYLN